MLKEAKLQTVNNNLKSESDLDGHLQGQIKEIAAKNKDEEVKKEETGILYDNDYQLTRAIDLIRGINLYKNLDFSNKK